MDQRLDFNLKWKNVNLPQSTGRCVLSMELHRDVMYWQNWRNAFQVKYNLCTDGTAGQIPVVTYSTLTVGLPTP